MFFIFESVILVFPKHRNFREVLKLFTKKSCKSTNQEHMKNCEDSRDKNKDPRGLRRVSNGRNYTPKVPRQVI